MGFDGRVEFGRIGLQREVKSVLQRVNFAFFDLLGEFAISFATALNERASDRLGTLGLVGGSFFFFALFFASLTLFFGLHLFEVFFGLFARLGEFFFGFRSRGDFGGRLGAFFDWRCDSFGVEIRVSSKIFGVFCHIFPFVVVARLDRSLPTRYSICVYYIKKYPFCQEVFSFDCRNRG